MGYGCDLCRSNPKEWNQKETLKRKWPFTMDRDMGSFSEVEKRMKLNAKGDYMKKTGDWDQREGCASPMIGLRDHFPFMLTHKVRISAPRPSVLV